MLQRNMQLGEHNKKRKSKRLVSIPFLISSALAGAFGFYLGNNIGLHTGLHHGHQQCLSEKTSEIENLKVEGNRLRREIASIRKMAEEKGISDNVIDTARKRANTPRFPKGLSKIASGSVLVDRDDFASIFDMGVPLDKSLEENSQVLLLYNRQNAMPKNQTLLNEGKLTGEIPIAKSALEATENCDFLNVVLTNVNAKRAQCIAIMGQYESFHIQKFMRLTEVVKEPLSRSNPLRLVSRGAQDNGRLSTKPPLKSHTLDYWRLLVPYLAKLPQVLERLDLVAKEVAGSLNTIIVMVCNHGQSELLLNFVCSAKARNLSLKQVLLFATDIETKELAESIGITVFFDDETFGSMPKAPAYVYADPNFTKMMMAKVYCVQLLAMLDYDFLFQDVDLIWFRNPLEIFHNTSHPWHNFDVYFQDDGNHALFYSPYSANTGFYYVRQNDRTRYFFNSLLLAGDLIAGTHSHQIALIALLNEHASLYGLKTKILSRDGDDFPGGYHYHNRKAWMRGFFKNEYDPYIFHMSWTSSKINKRKFMEQVGFWYLNERCIGKTLNEIGGNANTCCLAEPNVVCHYRDKPSVIPCKDSRPIDKDKPSFWD